MITNKTSKLDWTFNNIGIEKIILIDICSRIFYLFFILFFEVSAVLDVRYCPKPQSCEISRKTNGVILRKWQTLISSSVWGAQFFSWVSPLLVVSYAISRKSNEPNLKKKTKNLIFVGHDLGPFGSNLGPQIFFASFTLPTRHCSKVSSYAI